MKKKLPTRTKVQQRRRGLTPVLPPQLLIRHDSPVATRPNQVVSQPKPKLLIPGIIILSILVIGGLFLYSFNPDDNKAPDVAVNSTGVEALATTARAKVNAMQILQRAEAYKSKDPARSYPQSIDDFAKYSESSIPETATKHVAKSIPTVGTDAYYQYCSPNEAQVIYYNTATTKTVVLGANNTVTSSCK